jgi:isoquinoline 1-oxidoreductase beta subunit
MKTLGDSNRANYTVASGIITNTAQNKSASYGSLVTVAPTVGPPTGVTPIPGKLLGTTVPRVDIPLKTDGSAIFGLDVRIPGMVYAVIKHAPFGGTLRSTPSVPKGATAVVAISAPDNRGAVVKGSKNAVAVVSDNTWDAMQAASNLQASWNSAPAGSNVDSTALATLAATLMTSGTPLQAEVVGLTPSTAEAGVAAALQNASKKINVTYSLPFLAHATLEVLNCTVNITPATSTTPLTCEIWAPTQTANGSASVAASLLPAGSNVIVHTTYLGGGLGRKGETDFVSEAVQVALAINKPVKLIYPREEDFGHDQYRPMALINVQAGVDAQNNIAGWWYRTVVPSIFGQRGFLAPGGVDGMASEGAIGLAYSMKSRLVEWVNLPAGIPVGFWRSVGSSINTFAVESALDELALTANLDPMAFRKSLVSPTSRAWAVLDAADKLSSWRNTLPAGHAWGMAYHEQFGTSVCQVVDISVPAAGSISVNQVACVVGCGTAVNPGQIEAQMQGGIAHGLSAALFGQITFSNGSSSVRNYSNYRVIKMKEMPVVTVQIITDTGAVGGIGEPGVPPIGPAVANAYARLATGGARVRTLPFFPGSHMGELG